MQQQFPLVVRANGKTFVPTFPITLRGSDQLVLVQEIVRVQVPEGETWMVEGYYWGAGGPLIPQCKVTGKGST